LLTAGFFIICLYMFCHWRSSYQEGVGIPLTGLTLPHLCASPKPGPGFPMSYVMIFSIFIIYNLMFFWLFQLDGSQFYLRRKPEYPEITIDLWQVTDRNQWSQYIIQSFYKAHKNPIGCHKKLCFIINIIRTYPV
jgi:hypothetical protein